MVPVLAPPAPGIRNLNSPLNQNETRLAELVFSPGQLTSIAPWSLREALLKAFFGPDLARFRGVDLPPREELQWMLQMIRKHRRKLKLISGEFQELTHPYMLCDPDPEDDDYLDDKGEVILPL